MIKPTINSMKRFWSKVLEDFQQGNNEFDERKAAVVASEQRLKEVAETVVASDAKNKEDAVQLSLVNAQLKKDRKEVAKVSRKLLCYQTEMSSKEKREHDQDHIGRNQSIGNKKTTKQNNLNFVRDGISRKFESISDDMWWVSTNSSGRNGQPQVWNASWPSNTASQYRNRTGMPN
eukprot:CAMPEP_0170906826 /NCGR_PEP_ID=MMETSP0735-20130129/922_1 /TAXON_ID=186038 /ORGANISM="Fragilariopsis kerguelensis, Strain L26-C5" /LENGTH=175 /DNA_ID=CAMNT_0011302795 /DNA_START=65 /DNA_END=593 /DNA_ORIENTATION=+